MQTDIKPSILQSAIGQEANNILRSCVHCGFCNATCPTYQLLGDELDGPRGRIYLIKRVLETGQASKNTQLHLDRCLSCGACETTCPSSVNYRRLLDIGKELVEQKVKRKTSESVIRNFLVKILSSKTYFSFLLRCAQTLRALLPEKIKNQIPKKQTAGVTPANNHQRKMILFRGCVHDAISPEINASAIRVLDKLGISVIEVNQLSCCGAVSHHLQDNDRTERVIKNNIDALHAQLDPNVEAIFTTASACSLMLKDYPALMKDDEQYHQKALQLKDKFKDIAEIFCADDFNKFRDLNPGKRVAFHSPCTLQHGLKITNKIEALLTKAGFELLEVADSHICCGSAGTYSILQPKLSNQLLNNKVDHLKKNRPDIIATANIGCLNHIQGGSETPVKHWITLIDQAL